MGKNKNQDELTYEQKMEIIRPFVDFNYKKIGHSSEKRKINRYFSAYNEMQGQLTQFHRTTKKNRTKLQKATGLKLKGFKGAFIPVAKSDGKVKIKYTKKGIEIKAGGIRRKLFKFKYPDFLTDTEDEVQRILDKIRDEGFKDIALALGFFEFQQQFQLTSKDIDEKVIYILRSFVDAYSNAQEFMLGIYGLDYDDRQQLEDYYAAKEKYRATRKKEREKLQRGINKYGYKKPNATGRNR